MTSTTASATAPTSFAGWTCKPAIFDEIAGEPTTAAALVVLDPTTVCDTCAAPSLYRIAASEALGYAGHDVHYCRACITALYGQRAALGDLWSPFALFAKHDEWLGFGYIGARLAWLERGDEAAVAAADAQVLRLADAAGWDAERLFAWANSKDGRWYADVALGCGNLAEAAEYVR